MTYSGLISFECTARMVTKEWWKVFQGFHVPTDEVDQKLWLFLFVVVLFHRNLHVYIPRRVKYVILGNCLFCKFTIKTEKRETFIFLTLHMFYWFTDEFLKFTFLKRNFVDFIPKMVYLGNFLSGFSQISTVTS